MVLQPTGPALSLLLVSTILLFFSWLMVILRFIVRRRIKAIGLDDWLMLCGLIFFTAACQATITGSFNGVGSPGELITSYYDQKGRMWFMLFQLFYVLSTVPIKASICVALLRITTNKFVRWILYTVIVLATIACVVTDIAVLTWCRPVAATWDPSKGTCADASVITNVSYFISAVSILTDWTCAILPAFILWDVQLRFKIKASVAIVLGFGFVASTATLVRLKYLLAYNNPNDYLHNIANIAIWSITESGLGLIAGSLATLRPLLKHIPFFSTDPASAPITRSSRQPRNYHSHALTSFSANDQQRTRIKGGDDFDFGWDRLSDPESQKNMVPNKGEVVAGARDIKVTTEITADSNLHLEEDFRTIDRFDKD